MPGPAPQLTTRDKLAIHTIAHLGAAPPGALAHLFPSPAATYVRLGLLTARGLLARTILLGRRSYFATAQGLAAVGLPRDQVAPQPSGMTAHLAAIAAELAAAGYHLASPPRTGFPNRVAWFARGSRLVAVYTSAAPLTARRARKILARAHIPRHVAHGTILAGAHRTMSQLLRLPLYPPTAVVPIPITAKARGIVARLLDG